MAVRVQGTVFSADAPLSVLLQVERKGIVRMKVYPVDDGIFTSNNNICSLLWFPVIKSQIVSNENYIMDAYEMCFVKA